jgi:hypothetical protein
MKVLHPDLLPIFVIVAVSVIAILVHRGRQIKLYEQTGVEPWWVEWNSQSIADLLFSFGFGLLIIGSWVLMAAGIGIFFWQCYYWLQTGSWSPVSIVDGLFFASSDWGIDLPQSLRAWLEAPVHWVGLHQIAKMVPASAAVAALGAVLWYQLENHESL